MDASATAVHGPVFLIGRQRPYLDVRWLVADAEDHLAHDFADGMLNPWDVACFDRSGRPLDVTLRADSMVKLAAAGNDPDPAALLERLAAVCAAAKAQHPQLPEHLQCDEADLVLPEGDIPGLAVILAERFDHVREPPGDGARIAQIQHAGSRLHNFWHAIT